MLKAIGLCCAFAAFACMTCAFAGISGPRPVDVQAGELVDALQSLAGQCEIEIIYPADQLRGLQTRGVSGTLEPKEALRKLLAGTTLVLQEEAGAILITQGDSALARSQSAAGELSEVEIYARRQKLSAMRRDMAKLEDLFYARYNKLNSDHDFDIFCNLQPLPGSHRRARVCRPEFLIRAMGITLGGSSLAYDGGLSGAGPGNQSGGAVIEFVPRNMWIPDETWAAYNENISNLINAHPELRNLARERDAMGRYYEEIRKLKFEGRTFVLD